MTTQPWSKVATGNAELLLYLTFCRCVGENLTRVALPLLHSVAYSLRRVFLLSRDGVVDDNTLARARFAREAELGERQETGAYPGSPSVAHGKRRLSLD